MGVSHCYRLLSVRRPRMVMRARRGAASRRVCPFASALLDARSIVIELKLSARRVLCACALTSASDSFCSSVGRTTQPGRKNRLRFS